MSDLEFISTDDLIDELLHRHDHGVIVLLKTDAKPNMDLVERRWVGNSYTVVGLMFDVSQSVLDDMHVSDCDEHGNTEEENNNA